MKPYRDSATKALTFNESATAAQYRQALTNDGEGGSVSGAVSETTASELATENGFNWCNWYYSSTSSK